MEGKTVKILKIMIFSFWSSAPLFSQPPDTLWTKTFGGPNSDVGYSVEQTTDGGFIITGSTGPYSNKDILLIKTDADGIKVWQKTFGADYKDEGYSVQQTSDGGYLIGGYSESSAATGGIDLALIKTNNSGSLTFGLKAGGSGTDKGYSAVQTRDGGYAVCGSMPINNNDAWLIRTDSRCQVLWSKFYGGSKGDLANSIQQTFDGGFIMAGWTRSYGAGKGDAWLIKTDSNGNKKWSQTYGDSLEDAAKCVKQTTDRGYIIVGWTKSFGAGEEDVWLIKTDSRGNEVWSKTYGGSENDDGYSVAQTSDGGYIIAGYTDSFDAGGGDFWLIKTDENGNEEWNKALGGLYSESAKSVQQTSDGGYIVVGRTRSYGNSGANVWLVRLGYDVVSTKHDLSEIPIHFSLDQNYPNPFNPVTKINYALPEAGATGLVIYNLLGREVARLVDGEMPAGYHSAYWNAGHAASGIYLYRLTSGDYVKVRKMVLME